MTTDNTLAYTDQGSFRLRSLGRGVVMQYVWIYENGVDLEGLRRFQRNLRHTLLTRLIERSPLPFGRHRWVSYDGPADLDIAVTQRHRNEVWDWVDERSFVPIDPELGPPWRLAVQPLIGGGAAVSLAVSHTTGDAVAVMLAIVDAVHGTHRDFGFPPPGARTRRQALRQDIAVTVRSALKLPATLAAGRRAARQQPEYPSTAAAPAAPAPSSAARGQRLVVPRVYGYVDTQDWDARAKALGGTRNVLFVGFSARLGYRLGRSVDDGRVVLSVAVSNRTDGDTRANPLNAITALANPNEVTQNLAELRGAVKQALIELAETGDALLAPLALIPFTPKVVVRQLENGALSVGKRVGCTNIGEMPPEVNRPDGSDADFFSLRGGEPGITAATLDRSGGHLLASAASLRDKVWFSVASWEPGRTNTKAALAEVVHAALDDFGLRGSIEY
jgi:diacylglycerol O-acyltransferase / wax synthase